MSNFPYTQHNASTNDPSNAKFLVCLNGYPQMSASTFDEAMLAAQMLNPIFVEESATIYEVETGVHFDVANAEPTCWR